MTALLGSIKRSTNRGIDQYWEWSMQRNPKRRPLLAITGCGRSGTTYTSRRLSELGLEVGHERLRRNGISSWCLAPLTNDRCWGPTGIEIARLGMPLVHQVRNPLQVIASFSTAGGKSWDFIARHIELPTSGSLLLRSMHYWLRWNRLAEERSLITYRVEQFEAVLPEILRLSNAHDVEISTHSSVPTDTNSRRHSNISWQLLSDEDRHLCDDIRLLAESYGYALDAT